jgi:hypothetical protein
LDIALYFVTAAPDRGGTRIKRFGNDTHALDLLEWHAGVLSQPFGIVGERFGSQHVDSEIRNLLQNCRAADL